MFSMGKSNRTNKDSELIRHGETKPIFIWNFSSYSQDSFLKLKCFAAGVKLSYTMIFQ